ncbi:hypothetical protein VP01_623g1 [Puccinia sorghi]|uniref:Uncharacterized protein n=1 Tax=Puccinia sorghi TaxID=27349 RepID=A0A0L6UGG8_9BASI|nr:hypothetical protein VP01_623g1 [Puccinia sorghi]
MQILVIKKFTCNVKCIFFSQWFKIQPATALLVPMSGRAFLIILLFLHSCVKLLPLSHVVMWSPAEGVGGGSLVKKHMCTRGAVGSLSASLVSLHLRFFRIGIKLHNYEMQCYSRVLEKVRVVEVKKKSAENTRGTVFTGMSQRLNFNRGKASSSYRDLHPIFTSLNRFNSGSDQPCLVRLASRMALPLSEPQFSELHQKKKKGSLSEKEIDSFQFLLDRFMFFFFFSIPHLNLLSYDRGLILMHNTTVDQTAWRLKFKDFNSSVCVVLPLGSMLNVRDGETPSLAQSLVSSGLFSDMVPSSRFFFENLLKSAARSRKFWKNSSINCEYIYSEIVKFFLNGPQILLHKNLFNIFLVLSFEERRSLGAAREGFVKLSLMGFYVRMIEARVKSDDSNSDGHAPRRVAYPRVASRFGFAPGFMPNLGVNHYFCGLDRHTLY